MMNKKSSPSLITIIVGVYNHKKYIHENLNAIFECEYPNIELIVFDDASTDGSKEVIKHFQTKHKFTFIDNVTNRGFCNNLNTAIAAASGSYIKIISADDIIEGDNLGTFVDYLEQHNDIDVVYGDLEIIDENGTITSRVHGVKGLRDDLCSQHGLGLDIAILGNLFYGPAYLVRKEIYLTVGGFDPNCVIEDWDFNLRCIERGIRFALVEEVIAQYRHHASNTFKRSVFILNGELYVLSKYRAVRTYYKAVYISFRKAIRNDLGYNRGKSLHVIAMTLFAFLFTNAVYNTKRFFGSF